MCHDPAEFLDAAEETQGSAIKSRDAVLAGSGPRTSGTATRTLTN